MKKPRNINLLKNSRTLRKNLTKEEKHLWYDCLNKSKLRFRRQEIVGNYIADFYCDIAKLIIELDGSQHGEIKAAEYDLLRTTYFQTLGIYVLRFSNIEVNQNFEGVILMIDKIINERMSHPSVT